MDKRLVNDAPHRILLVEDNQAHAEMIMRGLENNRIRNEIRHVNDGAMALDYLHRRGDFDDPERSPRPQLVLLDLRLPKIDGLEVLAEIKSSPQLQSIPVVILTTSGADRDVARAYKHHANSYFVKPIDFKKFTKMIDVLGGYWLRWNYRPCDGG